MNIAEAFPVGEYIADELEARGWSRSDLAEILQRPPQFVSEIITGKKELTRESAAQIAAAFGTSVELWLNLQDQYKLWAQSKDEDLQRNLNDVERRARLNDFAPIAELRRRGVVTSSSVDEQEAEVIKLFGVRDMTEKPSFLAAARRSNEDEQATKLQCTWLALVMRKARALDPLPEYDPRGFTEFAAGLSSLVSAPEAFAELPDRFRQFGVGLVFEGNLPGGKIDGASFLAHGHPVIGLSGRGKRLDKVLFTLLHEVGHVINGDVQSDEPLLDVALSDTSPTALEARERRADESAAKMILPHGPAEPPNGQIRHPWIEAEARHQGVHPIVVVGQLQARGLIAWKTSLVRGAPTVDQHLARW